MLKAVSSITNAIGALNYKGTWNASTNTPALASGVGTKGDYYVVSTAGTTNLDGITSWNVGDWAVFNGSVWQRLEGGVDDPALSVKSNSTTGLMQITGPAAGQTRVVTIPDANATMARTDAAQSFTGAQTFLDNLVIGTAGKGIDFSINPSAPGMTSELLDDYETGTWTPTYTPATGAFGTVVYNVNTFGRYTKIGNAVFIVGLIITDEFNLGTGTGQGRISGLPFTPSPSASASINYSVNFNTNHPTGSFTSGANIFLTQRATSLGASATFNVASFTTGVAAFSNYIYFQMNYTV